MPVSSPTLATYLFVCRDSTNRRPPRMSPTEMGSLLHEWLQWHDSLQSEGRLCFCSPVEGESSTVSNRLSPIGHVGRELQEPVVGYLLIQAESLENATAVARGCPGLNHGFSIEIYRPFERNVGFGCD